MSEKETQKLLKTTCPVCGSNRWVNFFEMKNVPVHCNLLWKSREKAINCPKGDIKLVFCPICTFITNVAFRQEHLQYAEAYDSSLHFSPYFREYASSLAARLVERHDIHGKDVIEIGCGKGFFLSLLCKLGNNRGVGFDPTNIEREDDEEDRVTFIQDFYSEKYESYKGDLIVCRHVLEHIQNPKDFIVTMRHAIGDSPDTRVFFEVPNALHTFRRLAIWDVIYEHCSYFTPISLSSLFSSCGFSVTELTEEFEGQFLCIEAVPNSQNSHEFNIDRSGEVKRIANDIKLFDENARGKLDSLRKKLEHLKAIGKKTVIWGAGSKGVTFLNMYRDFNIEYAVDINPNKQGKYIPGTGQSIIPPEFLPEHSPDVVFIMSPIYKAEILEIIKSLNINAKPVYV